MEDTSNFNFDINSYVGGASKTAAVGDTDASLIKADGQTILNAELKHHGIAGHHISSLDSFYSVGLKQIVTQVFTIESRIKNTRDKTDEDREISEIHFKVEFTDIQLERPTTVNYVTGFPEPSTPNACQVSDLTYAAIPYLSGKITATATKVGDPDRPVVITRTDSFERYRIAPIPCGKHTQICNLKGLSKETLKRIGEDPHECGGTFIVNGSEWSIDNLENITYNIFHCHRNMYNTEIARGTFLSKPGDAFENSYQCLLRYKTNGAITVEITTNKFEGLDLPFYLLFRAVGMTSDKDIVDHIVYGVGNDDYITKSLMTIVAKAFRADDPVFGSLKNNYNSIDIINSIALKITEMANPTAAHRDENVIRYINSNILQIIDRFIFPHIGSTPDVRITKMRFLGHLINKLLLVAEEIVEPTDRDSLENKRIFSAGTSFAKTFKTDFNFAVVQPTKKALMKEFRSVPFSAVQLATVVKQAIKSDDLERMLVQAIVNGNKTITVRRNEITNRMSTQIIQYKNDLNVMSTLRSIAGSNSSASKQNERADEMRRVRPGFPGFICVSQSADTGESVGQTKQMAVGASISPSTSSYVLKELLLEDNDIMPLATVTPADITKNGLAKVFVNGDWIGCCKNASEFALKYRLARRIDHIRRSTTIVWKTSVREVYFWTDVGRMLATHIIVYNNFADYVTSKRSGDGSVKFKQWITLTRKHISGLQSGELTIEDLIEEGVVERLSAEECENCYVCPNIDQLREDEANVLTQYTHVDIEQSVMGLVALAGPLGNHSNAVRNTMFTNHRKQSAGWFSLNFPNRIDKNLTFQWYGVKPLVSAFTDAWTLPNGHQVIGGVMLYTGRNCEDSLLLSQGSTDLGMFTVTQFNYEQTELDKGEAFGNPDYARTMDIKRDASYEHIEDGFVKPGTELEKGTVLMVKSAKIQKPVDQFLFSDKSIVYKKEEKARVDRVIKTRNGEDKSIGKVKFSATRVIGPGDKNSSRTANKGICSFKLPRCDMPYNAYGVPLDMCANCHSFPTRMALNQLIETLLGFRCALEGSFVDGTMFNQLSVDDAIATLASYGLEYGGHQRCYDGKTGEPMDTLIFMGPMHYQRLEKFVIDEYYAVGTGPTSALTRQPLDGKIADGGLRLGEMEKDVFLAHGSSRALNSKFSKDSDGTIIHVCRRCHKRAIVNEKINLFKCNTCKDAAEIVSVPSTWVANLLLFECNAMNIETELMLEPLLFSEQL
jgi:DNA-directed RNA polymerase beta subunit